MNHPSQRKPILFVSNYCEYCKQVLALLSKKGLRAHFLIANVDKHASQMPAFLQRVPTILTENKEVLVDATVFTYIDMLAQQHAAVDIQPFYAGDMGSHVSDKYSYIKHCVFE
jgi:glutathione S-transferase